jgi:hypothetical protein
VAGGGAGLALNEGRVRFGGLARADSGKAWIAAASARVVQVRTRLLFMVRSPLQMAQACVACASESQRRRTGFKKLSLRGVRSKAQRPCAFRRQGRCERYAGSAQLGSWQVPQVWCGPKVPGGWYLPLHEAINSSVHTA